MSAKIIFQIKEEKDGKVNFAISSDPCEMTKLEAVYSRLIADTVTIMVETFMASQGKTERVAGGKATSKIAEVFADGRERN